MVASLTQLLELETLDTNLFRSRFHRENFRNFLFGGQVLSQALMAVSHTLDQRLPNSLHAYFLYPGLSDAPVIYDIETVRDGRSFSNRRAVARQHGQAIFHMSASFHIEEQGFEHTAPMPQNVPTPEKLLETQQISKDNAHIPATRGESSANQFPFHMLSIIDNAFESNEIREPRSMFWMKTQDTLPDKPIHHYCALAFGSDLGLLATCLLPHAANLFDPRITPASVDHAMWFHRSDFRVDEWLLYVTESPWAGGARGFAQGQIYTRDGKLVASTVQEGLIRPAAK